jgi:hypothetical protein
MAEIMGFGLSHYPGPLVPAEYWPQMLRSNVEKGRIPQEIFDDRSKWPKDMLAEWGSDDGQAAAKVHQSRLHAGYRELRRRLDAFRPDIVLVWGDDQYENFRRDGVPAFCVYIFDEIVCKPFQEGKRGPFKTEQNAWGLPPDTPLVVKGHREAADKLTCALIAAEFDVAYAFEARHEKGLSHAFANTVITLDLDRKGFDYPVIPFHVNCYGSQMLMTAARQPVICPPSPNPGRCFKLGAAVAGFFQDSPWRVALIGSSSWSHASLTRKFNRLYPDLEADRRRLDDLKRDRFSNWKDLTTSEIESAGQHEFLNWVCLAGAMSEIEHRADVVDYVESYVFNSSKCFASFCATHA